MTKHIAVLKGGWSRERDVSLVSAEAIERALNRMGYKVTPIMVTKDLATLMKQLTPKPDIAFNALHGQGGEDGVIQSFLEMMGIPYTHSSPQASAVAMDKNLTRQLAISAGIRCAEGKVVESRELLNSHPLPLPFIAKPVSDGSTFGLFFFKRKDQFLSQKDIEQIGDKALVEAYIPGKELTVGLINGKALTVTEILFDSGEIFDYEAKYSSGIARHSLPANIPADIFEKALRVSETIYKLIGCNGVARCDFRYNPNDPQNDGLYFLEINNQPGFTPVSLLPEQAEYMGMSFADVIQNLLDTAIIPQGSGKTGSGEVDTVEPPKERAKSA